MVRRRFTARRSKAQLVAPARPTPRETKALSDMDDCGYLRFYICSTEFFCPVPPTMEMGMDPAKAIRAALAEALVHYYPLAGRLREMPGGRLAVECTGEGVVFVEADADVVLGDLGQPPMPPYPEDLLCDAVNEHTPVVGNPLAYMQVTRLRCGAFALSVHMCHNLVDGFGMFQFIRAIADIARGEARPTILPVWDREHIFKARTPPRIRNDIFPGHASGIILTPDSDMPPDMVSQLFCFGPKEIATLRSHVPVHLAESCTTFELLAALMWRCRTIALGYHQPGGGLAPVRLVFRINARGKYPPIPLGYYGNAVLRPMVEASVDDLCNKPLGHALELVHRAKLDGATQEHVRSTVDMITAARAHPFLGVDRAFHVTDITRLGQDRIDMGWANRVSGGVPSIMDPMSHHMAFKNQDGQLITAVSSFLPKHAMDRLSKEMSMWIRSDAKKLIPSSV
uniref:Uncharacterized protein n=1 Tax=Avena sativa TaxID=4498 RepID=A0ACD5TSV7_AVESA